MISIPVIGAKVQELSHFLWCENWPSAHWNACKFTAEINYLKFLFLKKSPSYADDIYYYTKLYISA